MTQESIKALAEKEYLRTLDRYGWLRTAFTKGAMLVVEENKLVKALNEILKQETYYHVIEIARNALSSLELKPPSSESRDAQPAKPDEGSGLVWVKASEKLSAHYVNVCCRLIMEDFWFTAYYDYSKKMYVPRNMPSVGYLRPEEIEYLTAAPTDNGKEAKELGLCMRCKQEPAIKDYNGHGHYVCEHCYNHLSDEFDEEYK